MGRATLGGGGIQYPAVQQYTDWILDFGTSGGGNASNFQNGGFNNVTTLTGPDGRPSNTSGTAGASGVNINAIQDDGNGRVVMSMGGGITPGGSVNGGVFGWANSCGFSPQLIKPTTAAPTSLYPIEQQAALWDWFIQFGTLGGTALNRGDTGVSLLMGNAGVPNANPMHNVNTGGASLSGGVPGIGLLVFPDGFFHLYSATSITAGGSVGINDTYAAPPTDICRISFLIQAATLSGNATFSFYINKVLQRTYTWALGAGHPLPLWTDTAGSNAQGFVPQVIATPPGQDAQAHAQSGLYLYGFRFRRGPAAQIFASFASS